VSLPRDQQHDEENPGSHDHDLHGPEGDAARYVLRHRQLPCREGTSAGFPADREPEPAMMTVGKKTLRSVTTVHCRGQRRKNR
jgi:hypothetical protein